jgi:hypothetical protein
MKIRSERPFHAEGSGVTYVFLVCTDLPEFMNYGIRINLIQTQNYFLHLDRLSSPLPSEGKGEASMPKDSIRLDLIMPWRRVYFFLPVKVPLP